MKIHSLLKLGYLIKYSCRSNDVAQTEARGKNLGKRS